MKLLICLFLSLLAFQTFASETICSSEEAITQIGSTGSCRMIVGIEKIQERTGVCTGKFRRMMPCQATYDLKPEGSTVQLLCGFPGEKPALNLTMNGRKVVAYKVSAVITREDSTNMIISDTSIHTVFDSGAFNMDLTSNESTRTANITLSLKTGPEVLSEVTCN